MDTINQDAAPPPGAVAFGTLVSGTFVRRDNRFRVQVRINGKLHATYLANSGRLGELLVPGHRVWLHPAASASRRTDYDLALVDYRGTLVSVNAHLPNRLVARALAYHRISGLARYPVVERERTRGESRLDFRLAGAPPGTPPCWLEVKSVTLVEGAVARFPDAPTRRGRRHVQELARAVAEGDRASVLFVVQREDADAFAPRDATDPEFGRALRAASRAGVAVRAFRCHVTLAAIGLAEEIPVLSLDAPIP